MPRVVQLGAVAGVAIVIFLIWADYIAPKSREFKERADRIAADVRTVRDTDAMDSSIRQLRETIYGLGEVQPPRPEADGKVAMNRAVNAVMREHTISNDSFSTRVQGSLRPDTLYSLTGGARVQLLTGDLQFDATPDTAIAMISQLESRPEIESITTVRMSRISGRRVRTQVILEAWVLPSGAPARGGSI